MRFSKSFGYAVRGVLYTVFMQEVKQFVQAEEIALTLSVPRHFMSKILKKLVKAGVLSSSKGKTGGFTVNEKTKDFSLLEILEITDHLSTFHQCTLRMQDCDVFNPCPLHAQMEGVKKQLQNELASTRLGHLLKDDGAKFIKSIATLSEERIISTKGYTA